MKKLGKDLIFISCINRDGSGVTEVDDKYFELLMDAEFTLNRLSISEDTYIAHGFNSFVVRLR